MSENIKRIADGHGRDPITAAQRLGRSWDSLGDRPLLSNWSECVGYGMNAIVADLPQPRVQDVLAVLRLVFPLFGRQDRFDLGSVLS